MRYLKIPKLIWKALGPGWVTGASDDDPSGIATYSQAGAAFGLAILWTALFSFPLMAAVLEMCARIGLQTKKGLTEIIKQNYPPFHLYLLVVPTFPAITFNIAADIASMGAVAHLVIPSVPSFIFSSIFMGILILGLVFFSYTKIAAILKWLCLVLLVYIAIPFMVKHNWTEAFIATFVPKITWTQDFLMMLIAVFGTTISPYLFFWQTTSSVEDSNHKAVQKVTRHEIKMMRFDVNVGIFFSNLVMYFIILTTGVVLFPEGIRNITTVEEAAIALKPLAGEGAYILFSLGIIGTGFLAIPVLGGSLAYILADVFALKKGMDYKVKEAKGFYFTLIFSLLLGLLLNLLEINPIEALIYTAFVYGITSPIMIGLILLVCNDKKVMEGQTNGKLSNFLGFAALIVLIAAMIGYFQLA